MTEYSEAVRDTMVPEKWIASAVSLTLLSTPVFIELFLFVRDSGSVHAAVASYGVLFLWGVVLFLLFAWSRPGSTGDVARRLFVTSGWHLRDAAPQWVTGTAIVVAVAAVPWLLLRPPMRAIDWGAAIPQVLYTWAIVAPIETLLQAWIWPIVFPFGPITAQLVFVALHGARALDPVFAIVAFTMGLAFFMLVYLRHVQWRHARLFGPFAASSAHATWNTYTMFVALGIPSLSFDPAVLVLVVGAVVAAVVVRRLIVRSKP